MRMKCASRDSGSVGLFAGRRVGLEGLFVWSLVLLLGWAVACGGPEKGTCQADKDCAKGETCQGSKCVAKASGCTEDSDCKATETCREKKCVAKPKSCTDSSCGKDEICFEKQRCIKKLVACESNGACGAEGLCVGDDKNTVCKTKCDATTAKADKTHPACWGGWGHCEPISAANPERGVCTPPRSASRKSGEGCRADDFTSPSYHDCTKELRCVEGKCLPNCDPSQGTSTNLVCPAGTYCKGTKGSGLCEKLPAVKNGPKQRNELCSNRSAANHCDGKKGLVCADNYCTLACDPRKGAENNPICGKEAVCKEEGENSHLGGQCAAKPTQKKGERCSRIERLACVEGLNCLSGRCAPACDPKKSGECSVGEVCSRLGNACVTSCDPAKGGTANPLCAVGSFCQRSTSTPPGFCRGLPPFDEGTIGLNEACSGLDAKKCDGKKQLFCHFGKCLQACDLRKGESGNPGCQSTEECVETTQSPLGGMCLPKGTQKEAEPCGELTSRCLSGLRCSRGRCARTCDSTQPKPGCKADEFCVFSTCVAKCDPEKGIVGNTACPARYFCNKSTGLYKPGYCVPLPAEPVGTKKRGEKCDPTKESENCDGKASLVCRRGFCVGACDPTKGKDKNPDCASGQTCELEERVSFLGGLCASTPTQQENEACNSVDKLCVDGLVCAEVEGSRYCLKTCSLAQPNTCAAGTTCKRSSTGRSACVPTRGNSRKVYESCKGAPGTPGFDDCGAELLCVKLLDAKESYCLPSCAPPKTCADKSVCVAGTTGLRVCAQSCQDDADCKAYGSACKESGAQKICR